MKKIRERRGMIHRGMKGWHHHHTGYGSFLFHDYAPTETAVEEEGTEDAYEITWHTHDVSHDLEFNHVDADERPCKDPECPASKWWKKDQPIPPLSKLVGGYW